jgi:hypothetical protein
MTNTQSHAKKELEILTGKGIKTEGRLLISGAAHIITQSAIDYDRANNMIGTTGSGIGFKAYNGTSVAQSAGIILTSNTWSYGTYSTNQLSIGSDGTGGIGLRTANSASIKFFTGGATAGVSTQKGQFKSTGELEVGYVDASNDAMILKWNGASSYGSIQTYSSSHLVLQPAGNNVGIGSSINPVYKLEVSVAGGSQRIRVGTLQNNNNTARFEAITSSTASTANSAWLRVTPGGGFVLGTSGYTKTGGDSGNFANLSAESETAVISVTSGNAIQMSGNSTTFSIGSIPSVQRIQYGTGGYTTEFAFLQPNDGYTAIGAGAFNTRSDYRLKEDLKEFSGLYLVTNMKVYDFKWKEKEERNYGFMAHELQEVVPYVVTGTKDGMFEGEPQMQGLDYSKLVPVLVKAIQELTAKVEALEAK